MTRSTGASRAIPLLGGGAPTTAAATKAGFEAEALPEAAPAAIEGRWSHCPIIDFLLTNFAAASL
jgi:hypothetical protein